MTASEEILIIANKIANAGKEPIVALVKGKLTQKVPLPVIISTLKTWQHEPEYIMVATSQIIENKTTNGTENIEALIAIALEPIKQELSEIKQQLATLLKKTRQTKLGKNT